MTHPIAGGIASRRWILSLFLAVTWFQGAFAQEVDWNRYVPVRATGAIPEDMRMTSSDKYERDLKQVDQSKKKRQQDAHERFLLQSNFQLDEILLSGKVVFNDPITQYVTKVKDIILKGEPDLQQQIRVYVVKSPVVNAFATNSGVLLVNMGLIAHLRTEADLAVVLCHEIQHYIKKHPLNTYMNASVLKDNAKMLGLKNTEDYLAAKARYSREVEAEADGMGFELYKNSGYTRSTAETVFDILLGADEPFDQIPWDKSYFESEYLRFPARYDRWPILEPHFEDVADDSLSTHPSVDTRKEKVGERVSEADKEMGPDRGEDFQVGVQDFLEMRKRCRFELSELYLRATAYEDAIYNSYLLLQEEPESEYLHKNIARSIYGMMMHKQARKFSEVHVPSSDRGGEIQQLHRFTESLDNPGMWIFAIRQVWGAYLKYPEDKELQSMAEGMLDVFFKKEPETVEWVEHFKPEEFPEVIREVLVERGRITALRDSLAALPEKPSVDSLEAINDRSVAKATKEERNDFMKWGLVELFDDPKFSMEWAKRVEAAKEPKAKKDPWDEPVYDWEIAAARHEARMEGYRLGIDKVVMVQPVYRVVDRFDKKSPVQYLASATALEKYKDRMKEMAALNDVELILLENRNLEAGEVDRFNDAATIMRWISGQLDLEDKHVGMINPDRSAVDSLIQRYGTKYFGFNAVVTVKDRLDRMSKLILVLASIYFPPVMALTIPKMLAPAHKTVYATFVFDLESSRMLMGDMRLLKAKDKGAIGKATIYDQFYQIKSKPKK